MNPIFFDLFAEKESFELFLFIKTKEPVIIPLTNAKKSCKK